MIRAHSIFRIAMHTYNLRYNKRAIKFCYFTHRITSDNVSVGKLLRRSANRVTLAHYLMQLDHRYVCTMYIVYYIVPCRLHRGDQLNTRSTSHDINR